MISCIVERLRVDGGSKIEWEAADEIERLRIGAAMWKAAEDECKRLEDEIERLRTALRELTLCCTGHGDAFEEAYAEARAALGEAKK